MQRAIDAQHPGVGQIEIEIRTHRCARKCSSHSSGGASETERSEFRNESDFFSLPSLKLMRGCPASI